MYFNRTFGRDFQVNQRLLLHSLFGSRHSTDSWWECDCARPVQLHIRLAWLSLLGRCLGVRVDRPSWCHCRRCRLEIMVGTLRWSVIDSSRIISTLRLYFVVSRKDVFWVSVYCTEWRERLRSRLERCLNCTSQRYTHLCLGGDRISSRFLGVRPNLQSRSFWGWAWCEDSAHRLWCPDRCRSRFHERYWHGGILH